MKIVVPITVAAVTISSVSATTAWIKALKPIKNTDSYHMKPVHMVHARAQSDAPLWNETTQAFGSKYYTTAENQFRGALDTVNTASVEGALMYVQAEGIDYSKRSSTDPTVKCNRKNWLKYIVFYDIIFAQTNETLAQYESEYGPFMSMDGGKISPVNEMISTESVSVNGNATVPELGPFVGGEARDTDPRAPYPNCWWYSFPNTCPLQKWSDKTAECRASTRQALCDFDKLPDGITCTYNYRILGYVPIDDVVGITTMTKTSGSGTYSNFNEFCLDGNVEFETNSKGEVIESIAFWNNPLNKTANAARATKVLDKYSSILSSKSSTQIESTMFEHMQALPTVANLVAENPKCYENFKECATATHGCKRDLYSQICSVCDKVASGCEVAPVGFTFPTLEKATVASEHSTGSSASDEDTPTSTPSPTPTSTAMVSDAINTAMTIGALALSVGFTLLMG